MKPISLRMRGAVGLLRGIGRADVEIDLSRFHSGLIALVGPNGSGKTTILDNLHPYLMLASRPGSLVNHFALTDSVRDLTFELKGKTYRSLICIDPSRSRIEPTLYGDGQPLNDGRVSSYKEILHELLGSPDLFFKSLFAPQAGVGFGDLSPAERKDLFFELLDLRFYEIARESAKIKCSSLEHSLETSKELIRQSSRELQHREELQAKAEEARSNLDAIRTAIDRIEAELIRLDLAIADTERKLQAYEHVVSEREALERASRQLRAKQGAATEEHLTRSSQLEEKRSHIEREMEHYDQIVLQRDAILRHCSDLEALRRRLKAHETRQRESEEIGRQATAAQVAHQTQLQDHTRRVRELERAYDGLKVRLDQWDHQIKSDREKCVREVKEAEEEAQLLHDVPCQSLKHIATCCLLLRRAYNARDEADALRRRATYLLTLSYRKECGYSAFEDEVREAHKRLKVATLNTPSFDPRPFQKKKEAVGYDPHLHEQCVGEVQRFASEGWESRAQELQIAEKVLAERRELLAEVIHQLHNEQERYESDQKALDAEAEHLRGEIERLAAVASPPDNAELKGQSSKLRAELAARRQLEQRCVADVARVEASLQRLDQVELDVKTKENVVRQESRLLRDWKLLLRACSKDGIPALELDAAGPGVSRIANRLLSSAFDTRFQIAFETLKPSKDSSRQLETFSIRVLGPGGERDIADLSGGERVWIERSLAEAIAIYQSEMSGREYLSSFQDEADGALDPENRERYLAMLKESFQLGRRYYAFVVTQSSEIWQQIEQHICLVHERSAIELVY